jgi:hypothetical protein
VVQGWAISRSCLRGLPFAEARRGGGWSTESGAGWGAGGGDGAAVRGGGHSVMTQRRNPVRVLAGATMRRSIHSRHAPPAARPGARARVNSRCVHAQVCGGFTGGCRAERAVQSYSQAAI